MKLVHTKVQGENTGRVDVCGREEGHTGRHEGKYRGMVWEAGRTANEPPNILGYDYGKRTMEAE